VTLSDSLEYVGLEAFSYCAISTLKIAEGTKRITALMDITQDIDFRPDDMKIELGLIDEQGLPLKNKNILTTIIVPDSITYIEDYAFKDCDQAEIVNYKGESVVLTDNIKSIGRYAFYNKKYYNNELSEPVLYIDNCLIDANTNDNRQILKEYEILNDPETIVTRIIADSAFRNCADLTKVTIPKSVEYIGDNAFRNCPNLVEVIIRSPGDDITTTVTPLNGIRLLDANNRELLDKNHRVLFAKKSETEQISFSTFELPGRTAAPPSRPKRLGEHVFDYCNKNLTIICSGEILKYLQAQGKYTVVNFSESEYNKNNTI
jgi:hypothetical protein